jgi:hypothetical protein
LDANHPDHWPHVSIAQVNGRERLQIEPDFVHNLLGYVHEPGDVDMDKNRRVSPDAVARKGRVAFSFARIANSADAEVEQPRETIMMGPRASFSPFYFKGDIKDYSDPDSKLAGRKRYLPRYPRDRLAGAWGDIQAQLQQQFDNLRQAGSNPRQDVITRLRLLKSKREDGEIHVKSRIRLHNVTAEEGCCMPLIAFGPITLPVVRAVFASHGRSNGDLVAYFIGDGHRAGCRRRWCIQDDGKSRRLRDQEIID